MSLANFLTTTDKVFFTDQTLLTREPATLDDAARISDTLLYVGTATFPIPTVQVITSGDTEFTPLFLDPSGNPSDPLIIRTPVDIFNFEQLAFINYSIDVLSLSMPKFNIRFALYDASLQRILAYDPITFDPSNNTNDPPTITGFELVGFSVQVPATARFGVVEIQNVLGQGAGEFSFGFGQSQLENALETSQKFFPSRQPFNIFAVNYRLNIRDISGVEADLTILEAEVAALQSDVAGLDISVNTIEGQITSINSSISILDASFTFLEAGLVLTDVSLASLSATVEDLSANVVRQGGGDITGNYTFINGVKITQDLEIDGSISSNFLNNLLNQKLSLTGGTMASGGTADIVMNGSRVTGLNDPALPQDAATKSYVDTQVATAISISGEFLRLSGGTMTGAVDMGGFALTNLITPTANSDAATKQYVDNQVTISGDFLPLSGGTLTGSLNIPNAALNIGGNGAIQFSGGGATSAINLSSRTIDNLLTPTSSDQAANKGYVDSTVAALVQPTVLYDPQPTGFSVDPASSSARFSKVGNLVSANFVFIVNAVAGDLTALLWSFPPNLLPASPFVDFTLGTLTIFYPGDSPNIRAGQLFSGQCTFTTAFGGRIKPQAVLSTDGNNSLSFVPINGLNCPVGTQIFANINYLVF